MAAVQQRLQAHSRTRSGQIAAPSSARPLQTQSRDAASSQSTSSSHHAAIPIASPVSLFLTNLKLLDLDLLEDWPGISHGTFATIAANAQGQKKRIQCVEWALFHLFALWDPDETANKLKPFFPPLDQVQSLNLRAALLRCLESAKKNGVLGRDTIIRKTMMDECKGERLEEVLASFSAAVLKKVVADETSASGEHPALALALALEKRGYQDDKTELSGLILAHKISLQKLWEKRQEAGAKFRDFADLMAVKERGIARKHEEARYREQTSSSQSVSDDARHEMRRTVRGNWSGNERWLETLLHGDAGAKKDGPFGMSFDRVWRRVEQSRLSELEEADSGLLEQLDGRVRMHKERLEKWQSYRRRMFGDRDEGLPSPSKSKVAKGGKGIDLGFGAHEDLQLGRMSAQKRASKSPRLNSDYQALLQGLESELAETARKPDTLGFLQNRRQPNRASMGTQASHEATSEISELEEDSFDKTPEEPDEPTIRPFHSKMESPKRLPVRPQLQHPAQSSSESIRKASITRSPPPVELPQQDLPSRQDSSSRVMSTSSQSSVHETESSSEQPPVSPTQAAADQILESMNNVSPSPNKRSKPRHTLSLAERTRLSMAPRGSSLFLEEEDADLDPTMTSTTTPPTTAEPTTLAEAEEASDLISRTRRSMAGFEKAKQKAQLERRRSQRRSKLPPKREGSYFPREEDTVITEEMMAEEDMEAVFRSRPKIAASPLPSPTKEDFDDDYRWKHEKYSFV